jgi:EAL domain-containing protein (putative c-di-GMP-specific phosphodiesterase class I)
LSYLRRFPIDTLKIDQSFIRQIDTPDGASIVNAIIHLGRDLGMRVVAEGVETEQEATMLESMHCDRVQGYYFSRPLPPASFAALLECSVQIGATQPSAEGTEGTAPGEIL